MKEMITKYGRQRNVPKRPLSIFGENCTGKTAELSPALILLP
jgi:hypothetical protein